MSLITPEWPVPSTVKSFVTTRVGGASCDEFASFNLASHVGDDKRSVDTNRQSLRSALQANSTRELQFYWLNQVHGIELLDLDAEITEAPVADACITQQRHRVCAVQTADCLPLLICDQAGTQVAAVHAGWKGLAAGIVTKTVLAFSQKPQSLLCYLGPAISQAAFQVGTDVRSAFMTAQSKHANSNQAWADSVLEAFRFDCTDEVNGETKYKADLYQLAKLELNALGVSQIYGGSHCTYSEPELFYSYRRDQRTGRMLSGIWIDK